MSFPANYSLKVLRVPSGKYYVPYHQILQLYTSAVDINMEQDIEEKISTEQLQESLTVLHNILSLFPNTVLKQEDCPQYFNEYHR